MYYSLFICIYILQVYEFVCISTLDVCVYVYVYCTK
jgi:hypothetical protein